ncbi:COMPASS (complex proteins associated with Set1p) component [Zalaria obscura]|uniref:COMPASS (Complex proteins associated with Set1p) component n=1 Tax=Zalaria obscura TaxID=2024903 RepID=A0ACC3SGC0_9PEZI
MSSLSSLLNPAPNSAEGAETRDGALKSSQLTSQPTKASNATGTTESHGIASNRDDAAHALAALSASSIGPPQSWNGHSPTNDRRMSEARRGSAFGDGATLPDPAAVGRKMSSPSLEQYHLSRSPEQQRRSSVIMSSEGGPTLPPIHETENASKELGHDTSHVLSGGNAGHGGKGAVQDIAQNREPSYTREEPTTTQIRRPSDTLQAQSSADDSTDLLQQFRNEASSYLNPDTASNSSRRGSPAASQDSNEEGAATEEETEDWS